MFNVCIYGEGGGLFESDDAGQVTDFVLNYIKGQACE